MKTDARDIGKFTRPLKLFVAGLPTKIGLDRVLWYFQEFAQVELAPESIGFLEGNDQRGNPGHCILDCWNHSDADFLAQTRHFAFMGRTLTVQYNKTGIELIIENRRLNKSRLILKQVPAYVEEEELRYEIERRFGIVLTLYEYKKNHPYLQVKPKMLNKQFATYSVVMKSPKMASLLFKKRFLLLRDGNQITVEKYSKIKPIENNYIEEMYFLPGQEKSIKKHPYFSNPDQSKVTGETNFMYSPTFSPIIPINHEDKPTNSAYRVPILQHSNIVDKKSDQRQNVQFRINIR